MDADPITGAASDPDDHEDRENREDPDDPADEELPFAQLTSRRDSTDDVNDVQPVHAVHVWWFVAAAAAVVVVGLIIGAIVFNRSAPATARGARSAKEAAATFVRAVNADELAAAAAISCTEFADQARAAATSAKDPSIDFTLDSVHMVDRTNAVATLTEHLSFSATTKQARPLQIAVHRSSGRWLMCGQTQ